MDTLRGHNHLKAAGILALFALFLGAMIIVPSLRDAPSGNPPVDLPSTSR